MIFHLATDGSVQGKRGGWAYVLTTDGYYEEKNDAEWTKRGINYYELFAVVEGLSAIILPSFVYIYTDSMHVIHHANQPNNSYLFQHSKLWKRFLELKTKHTLEFVKVGSNQPHEGQRRAHILAKEATCAGNTKICQENFYTRN